MLWGRRCCSFFYGLLLFSAVWLLDIRAQMDTAPVPSSAPVGEKTLFVFDLEAHLNQRPLNKVWQYDVVNLVTALQGLVNRERPQLYVFYVREQLSAYQLNVDRFWFERLRAHGGFLSDYRIVELFSLEELIETFRQTIPYFTGVVAWDPNVPATGNVALTIAGVDGLLPVRHDTSPNSLMSQIVTGGLELPVVESLRDKFSAAGTIPDTDLESTGNPKTDAYIWARHNYIEQGLTSRDYLAVMLDPFDQDPRAEGVQYRNLMYNMIGNHDFYVSKKAFFFDLDPWWDEVSTDIPEDPFLQGFDKEVLDTILQETYQRANPANKILKVGGNVPWWFKYTTDAGGKHVAAETVEEFVSTISGYNGILDADNYKFNEIANASVFQHFPLKERYFQNPTPPEIPLENKNYVLFVIGDFRSSALLYQILPLLWQDGARGSFPVTWALNPILMERVPHILDWMYTTRTPNDYFAGGSTGAGLCFPNRFIPPRNSTLGDELEEWIKISKGMYQKFDFRVTVAADLDRESNDQPVYFTPRLQDAFLRFSPHGVVTMKPISKVFGADFVPFLPQSSDAGVFYELLPDLSGIVQEMIQNASTGSPRFHVYRFKYMNPTGIRVVWNHVQQNYPEFNWQLLDPITFFYLMRKQERPFDAFANALIPTFLDDDIPLAVEEGEKFTARIRIRNDGWDTWNPPNTPEHQRFRLSYRWQLFGEEDELPGEWAAFLPNQVNPGQVVDITSLFEVPDTVGIHDLILYIEQETVKQSVIRNRVPVTVQ